MGKGFSFGVFGGGADGHTGERPREIDQRGKFKTFLGK